MRKRTLLTLATLLALGTLTGCTSANASTPSPSSEPAVNPAQGGYNPNMSTEEQSAFYNEQTWFTLENITYDAKERKISGNCIEGAYLGEMEIYLPDTTDAAGLKDGIKIRVLGGPGMTMSLPPQLMGVSKIEILS